MESVLSPSTFTWVLDSRLGGARLWSECVYQLGHFAGSSFRVFCFVSLGFSRQSFPVPVALPVLN